MIEMRLKLICQVGTDSIAEHSMDIVQNLKINNRGSNSFVATIFKDRQRYTYRIRTGKRNIVIHCWDIEEILLITHPVLILVLSPQF